MKLFAIPDTLARLRGLIVSALAEMLREGVFGASPCERGRCRLLISPPSIPPLRMSVSCQLAAEAEYLRSLGIQTPSSRCCEPDFLIISPAKTGTTWLAQNLSCHPEIYIPRIKEIHYFNIYWTQFGFDWYLKHFQNSGNRKKGEATPYSGLSLYAIRGMQAAAAASATGLPNA